MNEQQWVGVIQQGRYVAAAVMLAAMWTAEAIVPMYLGRKRRLSHGAANVGLAVINAIVAYGFAFGILFVTEYARSHRYGLLHLLDIPVWQDWLAAIILLDCWQYWWHRINHRVRFLWRFHAVHHADAEMDATSGTRFHTVEIVLSLTARLVVLPLIGVTLPQLLLYEAMSLPIIIFHHSNVRIPNKVDRVLRWLIVTPWMHWVHHSRWQPETDSNYSSFLSIWDRLFGSFRIREKPEEIQFGLDHWQEHEWRGLLGMLLTPFRRRRSRGGVNQSSHEYDDSAVDLRQ